MNRIYRLQKFVEYIIFERKMCPKFFARPGHKWKWIENKKLTSSCYLSLSLSRSPLVIHYRAHLLAPLDSRLGFFLSTHAQKKKRISNSNIRTTGERYRKSSIRRKNTKTYPPRAFGSSEKKIRDETNQRSTTTRWLSIFNNVLSDERARARKHH